LAAPILGGLALGAGAVVAGIGLVVLPFYGGYKLHKKLQHTRQMKRHRAEMQSYRLRKLCFCVFNSVTRSSIFWPHIPAFIVYHCFMLLIFLYLLSTAMVIITMTLLYCITLYCISPNNEDTIVLYCI